MVVFCKFVQIEIEHFKFAYLGRRGGEEGRGTILMDQNKIFINQAVRLTVHTCLASGSSYVNVMQEQN